MDVGRAGGSWPLLLASQVLRVRRSLLRTAEMVFPLMRSSHISGKATHTWSLLLAFSASISRTGTQKSLMPGTSLSKRGLGLSLASTGAYLVRNATSASLIVSSMVAEVWGKEAAWLS